ncbi:unnamed protein product [Mytilus edulis]|uniref:Uncharacterized protein n=1 Tax=Mytilus edulis TaxID=6550 RepID=A0A8S3TP38_MYTED|nr:unnamed protein product [Mytilus edulis]
MGKRSELCRDTMDIFSWEKKVNRNYVVMEVMDTLFFMGWGCDEINYVVMEVMDTLFSWEGGKCVVMEVMDTLFSWEGGVELFCVEVMDTLFSWEGGIEICCDGSNGYIIFMGRRRVVSSRKGVMSNGYIMGKLCRDGSMDTLFSWEGGGELCRDGSNGYIIFMGSESNYVVMEVMDTLFSWEGGVELCCDGSN